MDAAAAFLAVRPRSIAETRRRLRQLGYPDGLVGQVVTQLIELDCLDDEKFARAWVESRDRARPGGQLALRRELAQKGVDRQLVDQVLAERQESDTGAQSELVAARLCSSGDDERWKPKLTDQAAPEGLRPARSKRVRPGRLPSGDD